VRANVTDLLRLLGARKTKVTEAATGEDVLWNAQQLEKEMDTFGRTQAYRALRAQDKRALIEFRQRLRGLVQTGTSQAQLLELVDGYQTLLQTLITTLNPQMLQENDLELWAAIGVGLEQAAGKVESAPAESAAELASWVAKAQGLYGRNEALDGFLRRTRKVPLAQLQGPELSATLEVFRELLTTLAAQGA
jgi:hypothetical protein